MKQNHNFRIQKCIHPNYLKNKKKYDELVGSLGIYMIFILLFEITERKSHKY